MAIDKKHHPAGTGQGGRVLVVVERRRPAPKWSMHNGMDKHKTSGLNFGSTNRYYKDSAMSAVRDTSNSYWTGKRLLLQQASHKSRCCYRKQYKSTCTRCLPAVLRASEPHEQEKLTCHKTTHRRKLCPRSSCTAC